MAEGKESASARYLAADGLCIKLYAYYLRQSISRR